MNVLKNGNARLAAVGTIMGIVGAVVSGYLVWQSKVEAATVQQRMVNEHDEALQKIVPKVEECHEVNEVQKWQIASHAEALTRLEKSVERTNDLVQQYLQSQMRNGAIPR